MGCFDIYCPFCGLPPSGWNSIENLIEQFESLRNSFEKGNKDQTYLNFLKKFNLKHNKNLDCKNKKIINYFKKISKDTKWLNNCTFLLFDGSVKKNLFEESCNVSFFAKNSTNEYVAYPYKYDDDSIEGIFLHTDCYNYISKKIKNKFLIKHIPYLKIDEYKTTFNFIKYPTESFFDQHFNIMKALVKNENLIISPLKKGIVSKNINKICTRIKLSKNEIEKRNNRPSPSISAQFVDSKTIALGNDNNIWQKEKNKWKKIESLKLKIIFDKKTSNPFKNNKHNLIYLKKKIKFSPHFILNLRKKNNQTIVNLVTTNKVLKKITKYLKNSSSEIIYS